MLKKTLLLAAAITTLTFRLYAGESEISGKTLKVTLSAAHNNSPSSIKTNDGIEAIQEGSPILLRFNTTDMTVEDYRGNKGIGATNIKTTKLSATVTSESEWLECKREIVVDQTKAAVNVEYALLFKKSMTVKYVPWKGLDFMSPTFGVHPDFNRTFAIGFKNGKFTASLSGTKPGKVNATPYCWTPVLAWSDKHNAALIVLPVKFEGCDIFGSGRNVTIPVGHKMTIAFSVEIKPGLTPEKLANELNENDKGAQKSAMAYALRESAKAARSEKKPQLALPLIQEAAKRRPEDAYIWNDMGYIGQDMKAPEVSAKGWGNASRIESDNVRFLEWASNAIEGAVNAGKLPKEELKRALELAKHGVELQPNSALIRRALSQRYAAIGDFKNATKELETALEKLKGTKEDVDWRRKWWENTVRKYKAKAGE